MQFGKNLKKKKNNNNKKHAQRVALRANSDFKSYARGIQRQSIFFWPNVYMWSLFPKGINSNGCHMKDLYIIVVYYPIVCLCVCVEVVIGWFIMQV